MTSSCLKCGHSPENVALHIPTHTARFNDLLYSNKCPDRDEEHTFRAFVIDGQPELEKLEQRIASVKGLLGELQAARDELVRAVGEHRKILNPMRTMPSELIREIFLYGAEFDRDAEEYFSTASHSLDISAAPWVYGRVCRRWKDLSIQTPLLWTRVKIELRKIKNNRYFPATRNQVQINKLPFGLSLLSSYLGRSNALPLCVYLDLKSTNHSVSGSEYGTSTIVFSHSRRWESLFLPRGQNMDATTFSSDSFPLLKHLHLQASGESSTIDISAPALRSWSTMGETGATLSTTLCGQITDYSNSGASFSEVIRTVRLLPNLRRLAVRHLKMAFPTSEILASPVCLLALKELVLEGRESIGVLLSSLSCPSLTDLSVTASASLKSAIHRFEDQSHFSLQRLDISGDTGVLEGLQNAHALRVLKVRGIQENRVISPRNVWQMSLDDILHLLSVTSEPVASPDILDSQTSSLPFPYLHELELHIRDLKDRDIMEALFACVCLRLSSASSLDSGGISSAQDDENGDEEGKRAKKRRRIGTTSGGSSTSLTPSKVTIVAPDTYARNMLVHPRLGELRLLGYIVNILAV